MSGNVDSVHLDEIAEAELTKQVMEKFNVDRKTATQIIAFAVCMALDKMKKWTTNMRKRQKGKAEDIYTLIKAIKKADLTVMGLPRYCKVIYDLTNDIEKKILEMCIEHE